METIENILEYQNYWETKKLWNEELMNCWANDHVITSFGLYDSSSPDGAGSSTAPKNILSERNRRKKLTDKLLALREAVPKITKLDKASIIKDAIVYVEDLQEEERRLEAEIKELENARLRKNPGYDHFEQEPAVLLRSIKMGINPSSDHVGTTRSPIQVLELRVSSVTQKTLLVNLKCSKRTDTLVRICEVFDYLKLKIITANVSIVSGMVMKTVLVEADEEERDLKLKIEMAIAALTDSPLASV